MREPNKLDWSENVQEGTFIERFQIYWIGPGVARLP